MIDFNPAWIYHLAEALTKLAMADKRVPLSHFVRVLAEGRSLVSWAAHLGWLDLSGSWLSFFEPEGNYVDWRVA